MMHNEFEGLIGRKANEDEYAFANALYLNTELTKQDFCDLWKKKNGVKILEELLATINRKNAMIDSLEKKNNKFFETLILTLPTNSVLSPQYDRISIALESLIGTSALITEKIKRHIYLSKREMEYFEMHLLQK
jgi:hypothetical protein